eukprot:968291-Alexandrium_andersonii.AAC.1
MGMPALPDGVPLFDLGLVPRTDLAKTIPLHLQSRLRLRIPKDLFLAHRPGNKEVLGKCHVRHSLPVPCALARRVAANEVS